MKKMIINIIFLLFILVLIVSSSEFYLVANINSEENSTILNQEPVEETKEIKEEIIVEKTEINTVKKATKTPVKTTVQASDPVKEEYSTPKLNITAISSYNSLMESVAYNHFMEQGALQTETINKCFRYRYSEEMKVSSDQKKEINRGMNILCNRYHNLMKDVETVINTEEESQEINAVLNITGTVCGWHIGGFSNIINLTDNSSCIKSRNLYHEVGHLLNYRWAFRYCENCVLSNGTSFKYDNVNIWTQKIIDEASDIYKEELGLMNEEKQKLFDQAYTPTAYAKNSSLERFAEMFARDMKNIELGKQRNRLDVILFDNLGN